MGNNTITYDLRGGSTPVNLNNRGVRTSYGSNVRSSFGGGRSTRPGVSVDNYRQYADVNGKYSSPPSYPDLSYGAFLAEGGSLLGFGYSSWRDKKLAEYNTAYNLYQQWYDSAEQQVSRINESGLNTNLAYGMATPGGSAGQPYAHSSAANPQDVFQAAASGLTSLFSNVKTLAEAAQTISLLPESKFRGKVAKALDVGAAALNINAENGYLGSLNSARVALGVGQSKAEQEKTSQIFQAAQSQANKSLLDYMTSHSEDGSESDFESSLFAKSGTAEKKNILVDYYKNKKAYDELFSKPQYWQGLLKKAKAEGDITANEAWRIKKIMDDENMDTSSKLLALQGGFPGFLAKLAYTMSSGLIGAGKNVAYTVEGWFNKNKN